MRVGWHGVLQSFADGLKLVFKEDIIVTGADRFLFKLAPFIVVMGAFAGFAVLPWGDGLVVSDLNIGAPLCHRDHVVRGDRHSHGRLGV